MYGSNLLRNQIATTDPLHIKNELHLEDVNVEYPSQFHFNTFKLNIFLLKKCEQYDINIIEDEILDIEITNNNISNYHILVIIVVLTCIKFQLIIIVLMYVLKGIT